MDLLKQTRISIANQVIGVIATHGRKFFSTHAEGRTEGPNRVSYFELRNNRLWFVDKYTRKPVYVAYKGRWRHFSEGGTLQSLVESMGEWIRDKRPDFPLRSFGPWPSWTCGDGDLWGYGSDMAIVRQKVTELVDPSSPRPLAGAAEK